MAAAERTRVVVTDANVLINLVHVDRLRLLGALDGYAFVVPPEVEAEVRDPVQAAALGRAFGEGHLARLPYEGVAALQVYAELVSVLGKGEAACLAQAQVHGWCVASDERGRFLRLAEERLGPGRVLNTPGLFVLAIQAGLIAVDDADDDKRSLEGHRFKMQFKSFRDVLVNARRKPRDLDDAGRKVDPWAGWRSTVWPNEG